MHKYLLVTISFFLSYLFIFFYFFFSLEKDFKDNFKVPKTAAFYKYYFQQIDHLRYKESYKNKIITDELIFNYIKNEKEGETILFQGDSWMQMINDEISHKELLISGLENYSKIINAGIASYSPSLMFKQYKILEKDFKIFPSTLVIYIDQTDMGDELCRYKKLIQFNNKGEITNIPGETFPYYRDVFNLHEVIILSSIEHKNINKFIKTQLLINYKIQKAFTRLMKILKISLGFDKDNLGKCKWQVIENYKKNLSREDRKYLIKIFKSFFSYLEKKDYLRSIFIVTHPHKLQLIGNNQNVDISNIVIESIRNYKKIKHINFSQELKKKNLYRNYDDIWMQDSIHLERDEFNIFLSEILSRL